MYWGGRRSVGKESVVSFQGRPVGRLFCPQTAAPGATWKRNPELVERGPPHLFSEVPFNLQFTAGAPRKVIQAMELATQSCQPRTYRHFLFEFPVLRAFRVGVDDRPTEKLTLIDGWS